MLRTKKGKAKNSSVGEKIITYFLHACYTKEEERESNKIQESERRLSPGYGVKEKTMTNDNIVVCV